MSYLFQIDDKPDDVQLYKCDKSPLAFLLQKGYCVLT